MRNVLEGRELLGADAFDVHVRAEPAPERFQVLLPRRVVTEHEARERTEDRRLHETVFGSQASVARPTE
jgi:hypothetical protein